MFSPQENDEDEEIGALGSILSWDDDEEGVGVGAAGTNSTLPDLVSFNLKDGGLTNSYLQQLPGVPLNQSVSESDASPSLNLPLPTPITFGLDLWVLLLVHVMKTSSFLALALLLTDSLMMML